MAKLVAKEATSEKSASADAESAEVEEAGSAAQVTEKLAAEKKKRKKSRWIKMGIAGLIGGTLIGSSVIVLCGIVNVTKASREAWLRRWWPLEPWPSLARGMNMPQQNKSELTMVSAAVAAIAAPAVVGTLFGVAGGLAAHKVKRRVGELEDFRFQPLHSGGCVVVA
jgi:hypothetical protein